MTGNNILGYIERTCDKCNSFIMCINFETYKEEIKNLCSRCYETKYKTSIKIPVGKIHTYGELPPDIVKLKRR